MEIIQKWIISVSSKTGLSNVLRWWFI